MTRQQFHDLLHDRGIYEKRAHEAADIIIDQFAADLANFRYLEGINDYINEIKTNET